MQMDNDLKYTQQYDNISTVYEDALVPHHEHARVVLNRITSSFLKPCSSILDVACGTGRPISAHFAANGYDVTGIDFSPGMLKLARAAVPNATFLQAEMTSWEPPEGRQYDLVIASHCFYNFSVVQIRAMIYKLSHWARKDGIVVIGMSYDPETVESGGVQVDHRGWAEGFCATFLDQEFAEFTMGREEAWVDLIKSTGLEIIDIDRKNCMLADGRSSGSETQFYIVTRRTQANPLIGPFPLPHMVDRPVTVQSEAWRELSGGVETDTANKALCEALRREPSCCKVLSVSKLSAIPLIPGIDIQETSELPVNVQPGSFDCVILHWILYLVPSPGDYIDNAIKAILPTGSARIIVVQASPDNELANLLNEASTGLGLPIQHHGFLLNEAENKFRAAGFQNINYIRTQSSINKFCSLPQDERAESAASLFSRVFIGDEALRAQFKECLKNLLKVHFLFKYSGEITCQTTILVAERK